MKVNKKMKTTNYRVNRKTQLSPSLLRLTKISIFILLVSSFGLFAYLFQPDWLKGQETKTTVVQQNSEPELVLETKDVCLDCVRRKIDGVMVESKLAEEKPYAVMIDNHFSARPPFGLGSASLVYEVPVEGGVTRYLAIFDPLVAPDMIGPVRSARDYFVNLAEELGATYIHCGGSPDGLLEAKKLGKSNIDEFFNEKSFWREDTRTAPHNVLTSGEKLADYRQKNKENGADFESWQFKDALASSSAEVYDMKVKYPNEYAVYWRFNPKTNEYDRFLNDKNHYDAQGQKITAKNVVIQLVSLSVIDEKLRLKLEQGTKGQALLCQDGSCQLGTYKKSSDKRAVYYYKDGSEFIWNAGKSWIEMVDSWDLIEY